MIKLFYDFKQSHSSVYKRIAAVLIVLVMVLLTAEAAQASSIRTTNETVKTAGKSFSVKLVRIDLSDPYLTIEPVWASGGIGTDESFKSMMGRSEAVAGINGTFFNAYEKNADKRYPNGAMIKDGEVVHSGTLMTFVVNADRQAYASIVQTMLAVSVSDAQTQEEKYRFSPWGLNKYYGEASVDQIIWYTPDFGNIISFPNGRKVVIEQGVITNITDEAVRVPANGHVLFVGLSDNNKNHVLPNLKVGDRLTLQSSAVASDGATDLDLSRIMAASGAGPALVRDGRVDVNFERDGFKDPKILTGAGARSFIGMDAAGILVFGTVPSATIMDLAQVAHKLGLVEAMNLDGGASSALFANGQTLTAAGRQLSNALVVVRHDEPQVQIEVNGKFVSDLRGYIHNEITMVPFRGLFESLDVPYNWDSASSTLVVAYAGKRVELRPGQPTAIIDGVSKELQAAPALREGRLYIPLRFVTETFGAQTTWDAKHYRAVIQISQGQ